MPKLNTVYDIGAAFESIENELMSSMIRNMRRHKLEEIDEDKQWAMWQALQLKALEKYKKDNQKKYGKQFKDINDQIKALISISRSEGEIAQEIAILEAIRNGFPAKRIAKGAAAEFFKLNDRKLEALIKATMDDMEHAEIAVLRMANDQYRKVIYNAQVYANTGAGTYEKAVDMATEDFVKAGLNCVQYANGARHTLADYADMAIRTASKRAYLQGEGQKRQEWGISTVIMNKRGNPCPKCLPFVGKVLIDDVWSNGPKDGKSPVTGIKYPDVVKAANDCANSFALSFGKMIGSFASIGITIASNLTGGIEGYLSKSSSYIRGKLVSLFNIAGDIASLAGDFWTAFADIFSVFAGSEGQGITADIIGIFTDGFLGAIEIGAQFIKDIESVVVTPIVQNAEKIKQTIENLLVPIQTVLDTLHQSVTDTFSKISEVYETYISPFITSVAQGISDIVQIFLDGWNSNISPVLDNLAEKFSTVWQEHVQPALDGIIVLVGKVFENLQALWETLLQPLIEWIIENIMPVIGPALQGIGDLFLDLLSVAGDVISGITDVLSGFIDFCTGAFTGDFSKCFQGLKEIMEGFKTIADSVIGFLQENVFRPFDEYIANIFATDWSKNFGILGGVLNGFLKSGKDTIRDIQKVFGGLNDFVSGVFSGNWEKAWKGIKDIFEGVFEGLANLSKTPINAIIGGFNSVLGTVNGLINKVNNIRFKITVPDWIPGIGGNWWGFNGFNIPTIGTIPMLANGGFVKANTPQLAMIGDNRHQGEIVSPEDKLQEMALKAAALAAGGANDAELLAVLKQILAFLQNTPIVALDPESLRKYFIRKTNQNTKATGKPELLV